MIELSKHGIHKPCLWIHAEGANNKGCGGSGKTFNHERYLQNELVRCVKAWRRNGGVLKDIPIYVLCMTENIPSKSALMSIQDRNLIFVNHYHPISKYFPAGWYNVPLAGKWMEENTDRDFMIHIDLDMTLLKPLDIEYILPDIGSLAKCSTYPDDKPDEDQIDPNFKKRFDTSFITSRSHNKFYTKWYNRLMDLFKDYNETYKAQLDGTKPWNEKDWWNYCNLEEYSVDVLYYYDDECIDNAGVIQFGNWQGFVSVEELTDEEFEHVYFLHHHYDPDETIYNKLIDGYVLRQTG